MLPQHGSSLPVVWRPPQPIPLQPQELARDKDRKLQQRKRELASRMQQDLRVYERDLKQAMERGLKSFEAALKRQASL
jgi:hypothetical protein